MTGTQTLKIYEILHRHFKNDADAKVVVQEIETIIDNKFFDTKNQLATKDDINSIKQDILKSQIDIEKRFNNMIIWIVSTGLAVVGLILAFLKF
ncbi:MAG: hypothetical protein JST94_12665 [Bacteroidetes bacterium]|nr:hypothetical protein [Bacteroidota bacterium]MBS1642300.1 hypothetical protein [Bacteroidota bacterium]MBS1672280.1 hypothetical protein [Bacteroidota bacterium]